MPKPILVVTSRYPKEIEDRIDRDFNARRNPSQFPFSQQQLLSAAEGADALDRPVRTQLEHRSPKNCGKRETQGPFSESEDGAQARLETARTTQLLIIAAAGQVARGTFYRSVLSVGKPTHCGRPPVQNTPPAR